jgi:ubiquitin C-terminal hydrolase
VCIAIEKFCAECGRNRQTQKQLFVAQTPNVLVLHLKRFDIMKDKKVRMCKYMYVCMLLFFLLLSV